MGLNVRWKLQRKLACISLLFLWLLTSTYGKGYFPKLVDLAVQKPITSTSTCGATASSYCQSSTESQGSLQACFQQTCKFDCCADCGSSKPNSSDLAAVSDKVNVTQDGDPRNGSIVRSFRFQSDSYIQPLRIPALNYVKPGFTISVWIKQKQGNKGTIISKNVTTQPSTNIFQLIIQDYNLMFHYKPVTGNASVASYTLLQSQSEKLQPNEWHLITVAVINKGLSYYIDGELMNANVATLTGPISDQGGTVVIGQKYGGSDQYEGLMQDIHVYARGLTNREAEEAFTGVLPVAYVASNCRCPPSHPKINVAEPAKCLKNLEGDLDTVSRLADTAHPIEFATDGDTQSFWLSKVTENVTINIDLSYSGLQVFYIVLTFYGPVPAGIKIERSLNNGKTFQPWQYFAENCSSFHLPNNGPLTEPDSVNCVQYDKLLPSSREVVTFQTECPPPPGSNIPVRPFGQGCSNLYCSQSLLQFLKATHVKFHFYNRTLVQNSQHRYFGLKRILVIGRCNCFGHASSSSYIEGNATHPGRCVCDCHSSTNTEGETCNRCKPLYNNKPFQRGEQDDSYPCVKCECNQHADSCVYNQSVDTSPNSRTQGGGGVCINCKHNTSGRFCQMCKKKFYRESAKSLKAADVCSPCGCEGPGVQPGNLDCVKDDSNSNIIAGQCECKANTKGRQCNVCKDGFFDLKAGHATGCVACSCTLDGTKNSSCHATTGQCDCKDRVTGIKCDTCKSGYYGVSGQEPLGCKTCDCDPVGTTAGNVSTCNPVTGQCSCKPGVIGRKCDQCENGFHSLTQNGCTSCNCSVAGTQPSLLDKCDKSTGSCDCKVNVQGNNCDQCKQGFYNLSESNPKGCVQCLCNSYGSVGKNCNDTGHCTCKENIEGQRCDKCIDDYYGFENCAPCNCKPAGSLNSQCDGSGKCTCKKNAEGDKCDEIIKSIDIIWMIVPIVLSLLLLVVFAVVVIRKNRRRNQNNNRISRLPLIYHPRIPRG